METEKKYDTLSVILMGVFAGGADVFSLFGILIFPIPIIGLIIFILGVLINLFTVIVLFFLFVLKKEKNLMVWIVNLIGGLLGIILPVKFIWILAATALGNSRLLRKAALDAALVAATVATGGAAAPAAVGEIAGKKTVETGARAALRRQAMRAGKRRLEKELVEGGEEEEGGKKEGGLGVSEYEMGAEKNPFEKLEELTTEVQGEEDSKFVDITGRRKTEKEDEEQKKAA